MNTTPPPPPTSFRYSHQVLLNTGLNKLFCSISIQWWVARIKKINLHEAGADFTGCRQWFGKLVEKFDSKKGQEADGRCPRLPDYKLGNNLFHWLKAGQSNTEPLYGLPITSGPMEMGEVRFSPTLRLCRFAACWSCFTGQKQLQVQQWEIGCLRTVLSVLFSRCCIAHTNAGNELLGGISEKSSEPKFRCLF